MNSRYAFLPPEQQRIVQEQRLREHFRYCMEASPFYRSRLRKTEKITLESLADIPFTDKPLFAQNNADFLAVPRSAIVDIVFSSGTTGVPTPVMYTREDLNRLASNEAQAFAACGITAEDSALLTCTLDRCFVAGFAYCTGLQRLGVACIRNGISSLESHAEAMRSLKPSVLVGVPVFLRRLGLFLQEAAEQSSIQAVRKLVCIGEPLRDERLRALPVTQDLTQLFPNATAHSTYASSECVSTFCECTIPCGGHLQPETAILEIVNEAGQRLADGETGEVVITPLGVSGMPLLRFRTGDMGFQLPEPCACGRFSPRLSPIVGRRNQMMKVNGTSLYPSAVFNAIERISGVRQSYVTVTSADRLSDRICVTVSLQDPSLTEAEIVRQLQVILRVKPQVKIEPEAAVLAVIYTGQSRKPIRFLDCRSDLRKEQKA